jgi:hypothetical protein
MKSFGIFISVFFLPASAKKGASAIIEQRAFIIFFFSSLLCF